MIIKKISLFSFAVILTLLSSLVFATGDGFYLGFGAGVGNTNNTPKTVAFTTQEGGQTIQYYQDNVTSSNTGIAGRFFLGVNFNQFVATEFGYTHYPNSTYNANNFTACVKNPDGSCSPNVPPSITSKSPEISENGVDLLVKGMYPIGPFGVFAKAGLAYIRQTSAGSLTEPSPSGKNNSINNFVGPELGAGVYYDLTPNWEADVSFSRVFHGASPADYFGIGIAYHFVTLYCGQFIC